MQYLLPTTRQIADFIADLWQRQLGQYMASNFGRQFIKSSSHLYKSFGVLSID
jgi:hypothetical protein